MKCWVIFLFTLLLPLWAQGATSDVMPLKGKVVALYDLQLSTLSVSTNLNILSGNKGTRVASSVETCNDVNGYQVLVSSLNAGELRHEGDPLIKTNYTLRYAKGAYVKLSTTPQMMYTVAKLSNLTQRTQSINVNVTAFPNAPAGAYSDTVVLTIQAH